MTMFISNTATAVLMAPIALVAAQQVGVSPYSFLFAVTLGASMCFASPFSTPPNALVMKAGGYSFMDYVKVGLPLQIIIGVKIELECPYRPCIRCQESHSLSYGGEDACHSQGEIFPGGC